MGGKGGGGGDPRIRKRHVCHEQLALQTARNTKEKKLFLLHTIHTNTQPQPQPQPHTQPQPKPQTQTQTHSWQAKRWGWLLPRCHCTKLQHAATLCNTVEPILIHVPWLKTHGFYIHTYAYTNIATPCHILHRTDWITVHHVATHCNTLQHIVPNCSTLQQTATHQSPATHCSTLQHTATHCNTLQHTTTQCNTLHHEWRSHVT